MVCMKNIIFGAALAILVLGIGCLYVRYTRGAIENINPVNLPFPGTGLAASSSFHIENGGEFEVQLSISMADDNTSVGKLPKPPIKSKLKLMIRSSAGEKNFKTTQYIEEFRSFAASGGDGYSRAYFFIGATIELPRKGIYIMEILNEDHDDVLDNCSKAGGMIKLVRDEKLETGLFYALLHIIGYACITISIISLVFIKITENCK